MSYSFVEKEIIIKGQFELGTTITVPKDNGTKYPAVLLVSGSGEIDRDGNAPKLKLNMNLYNRLSDFFAGMGFVTLRYDKRGIGKSGGSHIKAGLLELVDDLNSAVCYLRQQEFVDKNQIIICGHSEGCIATTIYSQQNSVTGLILIAGAGMSMLGCLKYQNYLVLQQIKHMKGFKGWLYNRLVNENNYMNNIINMFHKACKTNKDVIRIQGMKIPAKWAREHAQYSEKILTDILASAEFPILAVTGEDDIQAPPEDISRLASLHKDHLTSVQIPHMSHVLRVCDGKYDMLAIAKHYKKDLVKPLHPELLDTIEHWVTTNFKKEP